MRTLNRNRQSVWYSNVTGSTPLKDEYDNETGEYRITYSTPTEAAWNVGVVRSDAEVRMFGVQAMDTIRIVAEPDGFPLTNTSILWWGISPELDKDGKIAVAHNFRVAGILPSINAVTAYAERVAVSHVVEVDDPPDPPDPPGPVDPPNGDENGEEDNVQP